MRAKLPFSAKIPPAPERGRKHDWIRNNILGLVAIFIALSGSAIAADVAEDGSKDSAKAKAAKKKKKAKVGPQGPGGTAGANGNAGTNGADGAPGGPGAPGPQGPGAVALEFLGSEVPATGPDFVANAGPITILASCDSNGGLTRVQVYANASLPNGRIMGTEAVSNPQGQPVTFASPQGPIDVVVPVGFPGGVFAALTPDAAGQGKRSFVNATFFNQPSAGDHVSLQLTLLALDGIGQCQVHGTATPASP